jgi:cytochrome c
MTRFRYAVCLILLLAACGRKEAPAANVERGRELIGQYGCNVCHTIPGITGVQGMIGPSLEGVASRPTISNGIVQNTPENLAKFIQSPVSMNPASNMPGLNMPPADAQEIAGYLRTLR